MTKIGVVIPARNEENIIARTLKSIMNQTLKPSLVVVVNDNSTDKTKEIASTFNVKIIDFPIEHLESWVIKKELAQVFNAGLDCFDNSFDFVTIIGSDEELPNNHFEFITNKMKENRSIVIASGKIAGEYNTIPRGSGRIVNWKWWKSLGGKYPVNYGYESWLIAKCVTLEKKYKVYPNIVSTVQRPTATNYVSEKFIHRGQAFKALGYIKRFVIARSIVFAIKLHNPIAGFKILQGYFLSDVEHYDNEIKQYFINLQNEMMSIKNTVTLFKKFIHYPNTVKPTKPLEKMI